jgi:hypothetical protein
MTRLFYAWYHRGLDPYELYHADRAVNGFVLGPHPHPARYRILILAFAAEAHDYSMRLHSVHPEQHGKPSNEPEGVKMWLPGGVQGTKTLPKRD